MKEFFRLLQKDLVGKAASVFLSTKLHLATIDTFLWEKGENLKDVQSGKRKQPCCYDSEDI